MSEAANQYWDVFPRDIRISLSPEERTIPLSIRGEVQSPVFASSNPDIVSVDEEGVLRFGTMPGNAMIMAWSSSEKRSIRHVAVEVRDPAWFARHPDFQAGAILHVAGMVLDALDTFGVANATVKFRRIDGGPIDAQVTTNNLGQYEVNLREGSYYYEASAENYITATGLINVSEAGVTGAEIVLSPVLEGEVARIVLQWGLTPADLDSHLWGPLGVSNRFHVFFANEYMENVAALDVDDVDSYGPETITIIRFIPGFYRYYVHNYTNLNANPSMALAQSGAVVRLFLQSGQQFSFNVPNQGGTAWFVFEIDGSTGVVRPVNTMFYQSDPDLVGS